MGYGYPKWLLKNVYKLLFYYGYNVFEKISYFFRIKDPTEVVLETCTARGKAVMEGSRERDIIH